MALDGNGETVGMMPRSSPPGVAVMYVGVASSVGRAMAVRVRKISAICVCDNVEVADGGGGLVADGVARWIAATVSVTCSM